MHDMKRFLSREINDLDDVRMLMRVTLIPAYPHAHLSYLGAHGDALPGRGQGARGDA
jgi:hypothetical protein